MGTRPAEPAAGRVSRTPGPLAGAQRIFRLLAPHAIGEGRRIAVGILLGLGVVALHVARPWPLKWIVDGLGLPAGSPASHIVQMAALFVALSVVGAVMQYTYEMYFYGVGNRVVYRFRSALFAHVIALPLWFHDSRGVGELLTRVVSDTSRLRRGVNVMVLRILLTVVLFVATLAVVVWVAPLLGLALGVVGVMGLLLMQRRGGSIMRAARRQRQREGALAALVGDELARVRELQLFGVAASSVLRRFDSRNERGLRQEMKVQRLASGLVARVDALFAFGVALTLLVGIGPSSRGSITAGELVLFLTYALSLRQPFLDFAYHTARLGRTVACADRLGLIVARPVGNQDLPGATLAPAFEGALRFEDVWVKSPRRIRGGRKWSLAGITCDIPPRQRIAIVGGNGAGKSTLLGLVARLTEPQVGRVLLDGRDVRDYQAPALRDQLSVVFQDAALPILRVRDLIALGRTDATDDQIQEAARRTGAAPFIQGLPLGYETVVRRGGALLSGGERRRLALAGALLRDGRIWLLDEPSVGLDDASAREIVELLLDATQDRTVLWVTHDPAILSRFDWVLALEDGRLAYSGPSAAYRAGPSLHDDLPSHTQG